MQTKVWIHPELSDLFFNARNEKLNSLFEDDLVVLGDETTQDENERLIDAAILEDAKEFVDCYPEICKHFAGEGLTPEDLAADFLRRL